MKKLSLSDLSIQTLDKLQQNALKGGSLPSCVCAHICARCPCDGGTDMNIAIYNWGNKVEAGEEADYSVEPAD